MASVNKVIIIGHLGADPEIRYTQGGQPVASLRVATSESWTDKQGARQERTEWHQVSVWGKTAEACGKFLAKGRQVYVEGRLQSREYEKDGQTRKVWEIQADKVEFLGSGDGGGRPEGGGSGGGRQGGTQGGGGGRPAGGQGGGQGGGNTGGGGWGGGGGSAHGPGPGFDDDPIPF